MLHCFFFHAEDGIRDRDVTGVQTCALPISHISSTATTPPAKAPWRPEHVLPPAIPSRLPRRSWSASRIERPRSAQPSSKWKTNSPPPSPLLARPGEE